MLTQISSANLIVTGVLATLSVWTWAYIVRRWRGLRYADVNAQMRAADLDRARMIEDVYSDDSFEPGTPWHNLWEHASVMRGNLLRLRTEVTLPKGLGLRQSDRDQLSEALERAVAEEASRVSEGLWGLALVATIAPLLGLLGTVIGIQETFRGIEATGGASIQAIAPGVAGALFTTVFGLVVAIPAAVGYHYLSTKAERIGERMQWLAVDFSTLIWKEFSGQ